MSESKQVFVPQRIPEWHAWRKTGIGASEVAALMLTAHFDPKTPDALRKHKLLGSSFTGNAATEHGVRNEDSIIAAAEAKFGASVKPACFERGNLRASLDGLAVDFTGAKFVIEAKAPFKSKLTAAGYAAQPYIQDQVQSQIYCADAEYGYVAVLMGGDVEFHYVAKDEKRIAEIVKAVDEFWPTCKLRDDHEFAVLSAQYVAAKRELDAAEKRVAELKEVLQSAAPDGALNALLCVSKSSRAGAVDYAKIPELAGVDVEQYRKKGSSFFTITINKAIDHEDLD